MLTLQFACQRQDGSDAFVHLAHPSRPLGTGLKMTVQHVPVSAIAVIGVALIIIITTAVVVAVAVAVAAAATTRIDLKGRQESPILVHGRCDQIDVFRFPKRRGTESSLSEQLSSVISQFLHKVKVVVKGQGRDFLKTDDGGVCCVDSVDV